MLNDLCSKSKDRSSAAAKDRRQLPKARVVASEEVVRLWDEKERRDSEEAVRAVSREEEKNQGTTKIPAPKPSQRVRKLKSFA